MSRIKFEELRYLSQQITYCILDSQETVKRMYEIDNRLEQLRFDMVYEQLHSEKIIFTRSKDKPESPNIRLADPFDWTEEVSFHIYYLTDTVEWSREIPDGTDPIWAQKVIYNEYGAMNINEPYEYNEYDEENNQ